MSRPPHVDSELGPDELAFAEELLELASQAARQAAALITERRAAGVSVADTKTSLTDIVTQADRDSEALIRSLVLARRPDDGILGEEEQERIGTSRVRWVIDPIDGTVNYLYGMGQYAVSIGVEVDGVTWVGVVVNAASGEEFTAIRGRGSYADGVPLQVRAPAALDRVVIATGFNYVPEVRARQGAAVARLLAVVADVRRNGSCALDLCALAAGRNDGYVEEGCMPWDYAAAGLIAAEAGARFETMTGASGKTLVVAAPAAAYPGFEDLVRGCGFAGPET